MSLDMERLIARTALRARSSVANGAASVPVLLSSPSGGGATKNAGPGAGVGHPTEAIDKANKIKLAMAMPLMVCPPAFTGYRTEFRRGLRDSDITISILPWIERGGHGAPKG